MPNLTRREIVLDIYGKTGFSQKQIVAAVGLTLEAIMKALGKGRSVELRQFGVFQVVRREARIGRNPKQPGTVVPIPAHAVVKFKAGKTLKRLLKKTDLTRLP
jgi:nucleoid DNA-binding protein